MKPKYGAVGFENRGHHLPIALLLGLLSCIETWLDRVDDDTILGVIFPSDGTPRWIVDMHDRHDVPPKHVGFQSDYKPWEMYFGETSLRDIISACRELSDMNFDDPKKDTVFILINPEADPNVIVSIAPSAMFQFQDTVEVLQ